jgi:pyrroline-5-carboxylate reductase
MHISLIGGGNMASALIGGLLARGLAPTRIRVIEPLPQQRERLTERFGVTCFESAGPAALQAEVWLVAVKPQQMRPVALQLAPFLRGQLVISIAAGIRTEDLSRWLGGHRRLVRAMPNTPALVGEGVTGLAAMPGLTPEDRSTTQSVLDAVGQTVWVEKESHLDAVTAVSGSGPAYVFYFMESMMAAAQQLGLSSEQARTLTLATFQGAAKLASQSSDSPAKLREQVTSKGGTTAAALAVMTERDIGASIALALQAACERSKTLGEEFGRDPPA